MIYDEDPFRRSRRNRQQVKTTGGVCLNVGKPVQMGLPAQENREIRSSGGGENYSVPSTVARLYDFREPGGYLGNVGQLSYASESHSIPHRFQKPLPHGLPLKVALHSQYSGSG